MALSWPGQRNGQLHPTLLTLVFGHGLHPAAAVSFLAMRTALYLATGVWIGITEAYRSYDRQETLFRQRYTQGHKSGIWWAGTYWRKRPGVAAASVPGTSNHGWALALDINNYGATTGRVFQWLLDHAAAYGWSWTTGRNANEPWHWEYVGNLTRPATSGITPITAPTFEEDDMLTLYYQPTNNSSPLPDGTSRIWAGTREIGGILMADVWGVSPTGEARRLTRLQWEHLNQVADALGMGAELTKRIISCTGNQLEQIVYAKKL